MAMNTTTWLHNAVRQAVCRMCNVNYDALYIQRNQNLNVKQEQGRSFKMTTKISSRDIATLLHLNNITNQQDHAEAKSWQNIMVETMNNKITNGWWNKYTFKASDFNLFELSSISDYEKALNFLLNNEEEALSATLSHIQSVWEKQNKPMLQAPFVSARLVKTKVQSNLEIFLLLESGCIYTEHQKLMTLWYIIPLYSIKNGFTSTIYANNKIKAKNKHSLVKNFNHIPKSNKELLNELATPVNNNFYFEFALCGQIHQIGENVTLIVSKENEDTDAVKVNAQEIQKPVQINQIHKAFINFVNNTAEQTEQADKTDHDQSCSTNALKLFAFLNQHDKLELKDAVMDLPVIQETYSNCEAHFNYLLSDKILPANMNPLALTCTVDGIDANTNSTSVSFYITFKQKQLPTKEEMAMKLLGKHDFAIVFGNLNDLDNGIAQRLELLSWFEVDPRMTEFQYKVTITNEHIEWKFCQDSNLPFKDEQRKLLLECLMYDVKPTSHNNSYVYRMLKDRNGNWSLDMVLYQQTKFYHADACCKRKYAGSFTEEYCNEMDNKSRYVHNILYISRAMHKIHMEQVKDNGNEQGHGHFICPREWFTVPRKDSEVSYFIQSETKLFEFYSTAINENNSTEFRFYPNPTLPLSYKLEWNAIKSFQKALHLTYNDIKVDYDATWKSLWRLFKEAPTDTPKMIVNILHNKERAIQIELMQTVLHG